MGRELRRVPLDFDWPLGEVWCGYLSPPSFHQDDRYYAFRDNKEIEDRWYDYWHAHGRFDPPAGDGYQLWETTSEGSPKSPVFATLDELCAWCETGATTFASFTATAAEWKQMLGDGLVKHEVDMGNGVKAVFI